jgi:flavin reductase (DIM6/NTAB) family NADH-FMN oxidoreductase RutF
VTDDVRAAFNTLVGHLEYPMFIVTARAGDEPLGCLVGFTTQTSIDPPRFLVCLSHVNRTYRGARDAEHLAVHCVPADAADLAELFGGESGDDVDKFAQVAWHEGDGGVPILDRCRNWFVGRVVARVPAGDHDAYLLDPVASQAAEQEDFTFHMAKGIAPGHPA